MGYVMIDKLRLKLAGWLNVQTVVEDGRGMPESMANQMDASQITNALASAEQGYVQDLWSLYDAIIVGDVWIQSMLNQRKLAVLNDVIQAEPVNKDDSSDVDAAKEVNAAIARLRRFRMGTLSHLMDGCLRPVSVCEMVFRPDVDRPGRFLLDRVVPVPHYCQDFRNGRLELRKQDPANAGRATDDLYPAEPMRHIVHRGHLLTSPDNWGGPMRCMLFLWLLKTCNREWWARSLERWGSPIPVGKYPSGDAKAKLALQTAFSKFYRLGGLTVSDNTTVELIAGAAAGDGTAWEKLQNWAERQITIAILGQELSTGAAPTGMGSGVADLQGRVRDDITLMDSMALAETLTTDFAGSILRVNSMPGRCSMAIGTGTNLVKATSLSTILSQLFTGGIEAADDALKDLSGMMGIGLQRSVRQAGSFGGIPGIPPAALSQMVRTEILRLSQIGKP